VVHVVGALPGQDLFPKEARLVELVREQLALGRKCVVYVRQSDTRDIQPRLADVLRQHARARPFVLRGSVPAKNRWEIIERELDRGANVVICNPVLVQTGLDLLRTPTLIFYELVDDLLVNQQAGCRAWRIGQAADCAVYYLYYTAGGGEPSMEHRQAIRQGLKEIAARRISGKGALGLGLLGGKTQIDELMDTFGSDSRIADPNDLFRQLASLEAAQQAEAAWFAHVPEAEAAAPAGAGPAVQTLTQPRLWAEVGLIVPGKPQPLFDLSHFTVTAARSKRRR
jgi:hypothetical protein